jgi:hypothetical protein
MANRISQFMHCRKCLEEKPPSQSPRQWARLECGWTDVGWQVWCVRHECNVTDLDLLGQKVRQLPDETVH